MGGSQPGRERELEKKRRRDQGEAIGPLRTETLEKIPLYDDLEEFSTDDLVEFDGKDLEEWDEGM
jgi:hypothetical protein